jgi:HPt (histidine-containing phosphotransfer) domain-containing protein
LKKNHKTRDMAKSRRVQPTIENFATHQVITPPNRLKKAVARSTGGGPDPVEKAEQALANLSRHFAGWMEAEWQRLDAARREVQAAEASADSWQALFRAAHDIKSEAVTFGYPLVEAIAESLCRLIEHTRDRAGIPHDLIDQHIDAVHAVMHKRARRDVAQLAAELTGELTRVTAEFLLSEDVAALAVQDGVASPPLAPS